MPLQGWRSRVDPHNEESSRRAEARPWCRAVAAAGEERGRHGGRGRDGDGCAPSGQEQSAAGEAGRLEPERVAGVVAELAAGLVAVFGALASALAITGSIASGSSGRCCVEGGRGLADVGEQGGGGAGR